MEGPGRKYNGWNFILYVAGDSARTEFAISALEDICKSYLKEDYRIHVVDLLEKPELARQHQILAVPTVIRTSPLPETKIIGDLSCTDLVVNALGLRSRHDRIA